MMRRRPDDRDTATQEVASSIGTPAPKPASIGTGQLGLGTILVLGLIGWAGGIDPRSLISRSPLAESAGNGFGYDATPMLHENLARQSEPASERIHLLAASVLAETSEVWTDILPKQKGINYVPPQLVLYDGAKRSACGPTFTAIGPFYCPLDQKIYLDTSFFSSVKAQLGNNGDLAYTFLLAHEVGHHVQNELGVLRKAQAVMRSAFGTRGNPISIRIELMADCYAGVWAARAENKYHLIGAADVAKLDATAQAIGDDRLEQAAQGIVVAATFTHGTSAQRAYWFERGLKSGKVDACNTFGHLD
jgi:predicted metalloprotease